MESRGGNERTVNLTFASSSTVTRSYRRKIKTCTLGKYARMGLTNVSLALLTLKNVREHTSFISHGRTRQSNPFNLKTPLCRASTFKASYFNRITKLWNFVCSLKSSSSFSSKQSFNQFVYKTVSVNTFEVERSCTWTLVITCPCHMSK